MLIPLRTNNTRDLTTHSNAGLTSIYVIIRRIIICTSWRFQFKSLSELNSSSLLSPIASLPDIFPVHESKGSMHLLHSEMHKIWCKQVDSSCSHIYHHGTFCLTHTNGTEAYEWSQVHRAHHLPYYEVWDLLTPCSVLHHSASWYWALSTLCAKASAVGGRVHSLGAIRLTFPFFVPTAAGDIQSLKNSLYPRHSTQPWM